MPSALVIGAQGQSHGWIRRVLEQANFAVRSGQAVEAAEHYIRDPTDVVVVNIVAPRSDEIYAIKRIRETSAGARIVAITGGGQLGWVEKPTSVVTQAYLALASQYGANAVMANPSDPRALVTCVCGLLRRLH